MRTSLWLLAAAVCVVCVDASAQQAQSQPAFSKTQSLICGRSDVSIQTRCSASIDGAPPNCVQTLVFKGQSGKDRFIAYKPEPARHSDEPFVNQLGCSSAGRKPYVIARSGNFASCATCEWIDVFTVRGELVGSTPSVVRALKLPRKPLPQGLEASLGQPREDESVFLSRISSRK